MTSSFQQGKPMQWDFVKGKAMGSSLSPDLLKISEKMYVMPKIVFKVCY